MLSERNIAICKSIFVNRKPSKQTAVDFNITTERVFQIKRKAIRTANYLVSRASSLAHVDIEKYDGSAKAIKSMTDKESFDLFSTIVFADNKRYGGL